MDPKTPPSAPEKTGGETEPEPPAEQLVNSGGMAGEGGARPDDA